MVRVIDVVAVVSCAVALAACGASVAPVDGASDGSDAVTDSGPDDHGGGCTLANGQICGERQTCPAGDGCNSCGCMSGLLTCTTVACDAGPRPCTSNADCASTEQCVGSPGCGTTWTCASNVLCAGGVASYCDCNGTTFQALPGCPGRPYAHDGPCETPDAGCFPDGTQCNHDADCCSGYCPALGAPVSTCMTPPDGGTPDGGTCASLDAPCGQDSDCCSGYCPRLGADMSRCAIADGGTTSFACGNLVCTLGAEYCQETEGGITNVPSYMCQPLPEACATSDSCSCLATVACGSMCTQAADGSMTVLCLVD